MIKLNRIGNKIGLGWRGRRLAGGWHGGQPDDHRSASNGPANAPVATGGRQPASAYHCADQLLPPAMSGWPDRLPMSTRSLPICSGSSPAKRRNWKRRSAAAQAQDTRERREGKIPDGELTAAREDLAKAQSIPACADRQALGGFPDGMDQGASRRSWGRRRWPSWTTAPRSSRSLLQADARVNALRAAAWRPGATGDASPIAAMTQDRGRAEGRVSTELRGEAGTTGDLLVVELAGSSIVKRFLAANDEAVKTEQLKADTGACVETHGSHAEAAELDGSDRCGCATEYAQTSKEAAMSQISAQVAWAKLPECGNGDRRRRIADRLEWYSPSFGGLASDDAPERSAGRDGGRQSRCRDSGAQPWRRNRRSRQDGYRHSRECRATARRGWSQDRSRTRSRRSGARRR